MAEINNNIQNFGINTDKIGSRKNSEPVKEAAIQEESKEHNYVPDTGVLGRSQIKNVHGSDIQKSVDEAVSLAKNNPALMGCSEGIFDYLYKDYINNGMDSSEAYMKALLAEEEFLATGASVNK